VALTPFAEARRHVVERCARLAARPAPLDDALGAVVAEAVVATEAVPPFANSAMDGYAVRAVDLAGASADLPGRLRVVGAVAAGAAPGEPVVPGSAVRIMTGAPVPSGADAIVPVELATVDGDHVLLADAPPTGRHIRPAGDDVAPGQEVVAAGTLLGPAHLGALASVGVRRPLVVPRPRVAVLSTGDELADHDGPLAPGQIRESNRPTLVAACRGFGVDAVDAGTVPDDADAIRQAVADAARSHDAVVTSGGVSMGDVDLVKVVLDELGDMRWMQVAIRPAKPFAFGLVGSTPVFGLPGNPVSSLVSLALLALPGLRSLAGRTDLDLPRVPAAARGPLAGGGDGRTSFVRVHVRWAGAGFEATPVTGQGSHHLAAAAGANGLAVLEPGVAVAAGAPVEVVLLRDPFVA
jgi:molybdopterin molybdotransferase